MPFVSAQVTTGATAVSLMPVARFKNQLGTLADPIPVTLQNIDATNNVYVGGADVSATNGYLLAKGATVQITVVGSPPYALAAAGTPIVAVLCGRQ